MFRTPPQAVKDLDGVIAWGFGCVRATGGVLARAGFLAPREGSDRKDVLTWRFWTLLDDRPENFGIASGVPLRVVALSGGPRPMET